MQQRCPVLVSSPANTVGSGELKDQLLTATRKAKYSCTIFDNYRNKMRCSSPARTSGGFQTWMVVLTFVWIQICPFWRSCSILTLAAALRLNVRCIQRQKLSLLDVFKLELKHRTANTALRAGFSWSLCHIDIRMLIYQHYDQYDVNIDIMIS